MPRVHPPRQLDVRLHHIAELGRIETAMVKEVVGVRAIVREVRVAPEQELDGLAFQLQLHGANFDISERLVLLRSVRRQCM